MQMASVGNLFVQAMNPKRLPVMLGKIWKRVFDAHGSLSQEANLAWIRSQCSDFASMAQKADDDLWQETLSFQREFQREATETLSKIQHQLGGGGIYPLLYFLTRYTKPECIVETGVAAGYSSRAFLAALDANGTGRLYSSDFPYFRLANPERFIGVLVPERLKSRWELYIDGDAANLPRILARTKTIDIFHYDSDKSYSGRQAVMRFVQGHLHPTSVVVMDDIQDNSFFHDHVATMNATAWHVFEFERKYVGIVGQLPA